jgi:FkbM family methyltransferase
MIKINGKWGINLPESAASEWIGNMEHHHNTWEMPRLETLRGLIKPGTVVLYIGAYKGDMAALLASWGAKLMLVESSPGFWSEIKKTWDMNDIPQPVAFFSGLISNKTTSELSKDELTNWPTRTEEFVEGFTGFTHLAESHDYFPEITIDDFIERTGIKPDIITIDIEGSELEACKGAIKTIESDAPIFVLSIHPEFMFHNHGTYERELHDLLRDRGYKGTWLDYDHEHHWCYQKQELGTILEKL